MSDLTPRDVELFSGGMADIDSTNNGKSAEIIENLDITSSGKLKQRPGSDLLDQTPSLIDATTGVRANGQTGSFINYEDDLHLLIRAKDAIYGKNSSSWSDSASSPWAKVDSPNTGWEALPSYGALTAHTVVSSVPWQGHELLVGYDPATGAYISPQKLYLDDNTTTPTFQVRNAGLPAPEDPAGFVTYSGVMKHAIVLANLIKAGLNTHFADLEAHATATAAVAEADATDELTLVALTIALRTAYNSHANFEVGFGATEHRISQMGTTFGYQTTTQTASLNYVVQDSADPTNAYECARLLNQLLWAINLHIIAFIDADETVTTANFPQNTSVTAWNLNPAAAQFSGANSLRTGDQVVFYGGTLPGGITAGSAYFVIDDVSGWVRLADSLANAIAGTAKILTGSPTGVAVLKPYTNLHPKITGRIVTPAAMSPYCYPEGYTMSAGGGYPHLNSEMISYFREYSEDVRTHFRKNALISSDQIHAENGSFGYMSSVDNLFVNEPLTVNDLVYTLDWQIFAGVIKAYAAFRVHRAEGGRVHAGGAEAGGTAPTVAKSNWITKYAPNPFDTATWELLETIVTDAYAKLHTHGQQSAPRHVNTQTRTYSGTTPDLVFSQRRYAMVFSTRYRTYKKLTFEEKSAPSFSDSYCVAHTNAGTANYAPYKYYILFDALESLGISTQLPGMENYDSESVYLEIYRTLDGGTVFYRANQMKSSVTNTIANIYDFTDDAALEAAAVELYTTGGVQGREPAPRCKSVARQGDYLAFGGVVEEAAPTIRAVTLTDNTIAFSDALVESDVLREGQAVVLWGIVSGQITSNTLRTGKIYYVKNLTGSGFGLSETPGGTALVFDVISPPVSAYIATQNLVELPNRVRQSFPAIGFSSPSSFYVDLESDVVQVGAAQEHFVAVCKQGIYRTEGKFNEDGTGGMFAKKISERVSGVSALGGITVGGLFFFMARDGFYMTDGYTVKPLSSHLKKRHQDIVTQKLSTYEPRNYLVQASYDRFQNRIMWTVNSSPEAPDPDYSTSPTEIWVLHLNHTEDQRGAFTVWNNGSCFSPTALGYFRGNVIRGDETGYVLKHTEDLTNDLDFTDLSSDNYLHIPFKLRSLPENFGIPGARKWVAKILALFTNNGNLTVGLKSINDSNVDNAVAMKGIRHRGEYSGLIKEKRTFPAGAGGTAYNGLRCHEKQIQMEPEEAILYRSDSYATLNVVGGIGTVTAGTLPEPVGTMKGFKIYFDSDAYTTGHTITANGVNTVSTGSGGLNLTGAKWIIKGRPKNETLEVQGYTLYASSVQSQPSPPTGSSGGNA